MMILSSSSHTTASGPGTAAFRSTWIHHHLLVGFVLIFLLSVLNRSLFVFFALFTYGQWIIVPTSIYGIVKLVLLWLIQLSSICHISIDPFCVVTDIHICRHFHISLTSNFATLFLRVSCHQLCLHLLSSLVLYGLHGVHV